MKSLLGVPTGKTYSGSQAGRSGAPEGLGRTGNLSPSCSGSGTISFHLPHETPGNWQVSVDSFKKEAQGEPLSLRDGIAFELGTAFQSLEHCCGARRREEAARWLKRTELGPGRGAEGAKQRAGCEGG